MKNTAMYYLNLLALPLLFIAFLIANMYKLNKQAVRWTMSETANAYESNRRCFKQGE